LIKNFSSLQLEGSHNKKQVLLAPSWGKNALLENHGHQIVKILLDNGYDVIVRTHPVTINKESRLINSLKEDFKNNPNFILETDTRSFNSLYFSQFLISDWSGIALEYAFSLERPVLFVDVPKKINNPNYEKISYLPIEVSLRKKLGDIVSTQQLEKIPEKLEYLYKNLETFRNQIIKIRSQTIFNLGSSGKIGAKYIAKIADEQKNTMN